MKLNLRQTILRATRLLPNVNNTDYGYGAPGKVRPGAIDLVPGIGPYRPEAGCVWLKDDCQTYWEVADDDLKKGLVESGGTASS